MNLKELMGLFSQGKASARSHMKNLIELAAVDGNFDDVEFGLLKSIAMRNNISESQLKSIRQNPDKIVFEVPSDSKEKFFQLYDLVHMMTVDKQIHSEEMKLTNIFAVKFGYKRENIKELIDTIQSNILHNQTHEETFKRVSLLVV